MKDFIYVSAIIILLSLLVVQSNFENNNLNKEVSYIEKTDTIYIQNYDSINKLNEIIIGNYKKLDSLKSAIFVYDYKLARIKEYNDIAAKGNNIKYLRGWINRVLIE